MDVKTKGSIDDRICFRLYNITFYNRQTFHFAIPLCQIPLSHHFIPFLKIRKAIFQKKLPNSYDFAHFSQKNKPKSPFRPVPLIPLSSFSPSGSAALRSAPSQSPDDPPVPRRISSVRQLCQSSAPALRFLLPSLLRHPQADRM